MTPLNVVGRAHEAPESAPFTWFVYGSSLDREAFSAWATDHGYRLPDFSAARPARLAGFRLAFDAPSRMWGGPVASLAEDPAGHVEGLAVPMPGSSRGLVEHKEGAVSGLYVPLEVTLETAAGPVPALAFRVAPARRLVADGPPSPSYLDVMIRGARSSGLSPGWIARLEALAR
ncbi:MAG TPA: gamma-glutamylcyclotransferase [Anaeromyxobacteraceae bacterium]|nr:gamma-glutamylcyclotransferase [Anaeromyxobacteraceae bacterium]